jgi:catechol 2,3-dioxygenase-like lactoylglutathione lyase family enzyme
MSDLVASVAGMALSIGMVTVDCADPSALSRFWSAALDTTVVTDYDGEFIMLAPPPEGGPLLAFQHVPERRSGKNRLHLDLGAPTGGREAEVERLVQLGATVLGERGDPAVFAWTTLTDPEGNEFCVGEAEPAAAGLVTPPAAP